MARWCVEVVDMMVVHGAMWSGGGGGGGGDRWCCMVVVAGGGGALRWYVE